MRLSGTCKVVQIPSIPLSDLTKSQSRLEGKLVSVTELSSSMQRLKVRDFDIQTIIDAGLIDKLALGSPIKLSMLERQDSIYSASEFVEKLDLQADVEKRQIEIQKSLAELDKHSQSVQNQQSSTKDSVNQ